MVAQCCGYNLSSSGEKVLRWGWFIITGVVLLTGIIMTSVGSGAVYGIGIVMILVSIAAFVLWVCYQCNVGGWKEKGCKNCLLGCGGCCPQTDSGTL